MALTPAVLKALKKIAPWAWLCRSSTPEVVKPKGQARSVGAERVHRIDHDLVVQRRRVLTDKRLGGGPRGGENDCVDPGDRAADALGHEIARCRRLAHPINNVVATCAKRRTQGFAEAPSAKNGNPHLSSSRFVAWATRRCPESSALLLQQTWALR